MSYVPPHLRNSSANPVSAAKTLVNGNSDHFHSKQLNGSYSQFASAKSNNNNGNSINLWNAGSRSSGNYAASVPEPVAPQWQPSDRVMQLNAEQVEEVCMRLNVDATVPPDSQPASAPIESFTDMNLHASIMKDIAFHGYTTPTSIQAQAMPVALSGRDLLGCAETGSGKTAAFTIPMIQHCLAQPPIRRGDGPLALVLAPTRELAQQIEKEVKAFSRSLDSFKTAIVVGGTNISEQRSELRAGVSIVVATPGRFIDHLQQGNTSLLRISFVILDEADRMLDMGFEPQIREVMQNIPKKHQTLLFSATMPVEIEELAQEYLTDPVRIKVGKVSSPTANVSQVLEKVPENEKIDRLLDMLVEAAAQSQKCSHSFPLTIVFVERKSRCDEVADALIQQGLQAASLHGGRSQSEREAALHDFRHGPTRILVATDVASRGLDVTGVAHVINLDLPKTMEDYVHRIGRTGRAGSTGQATSFYTDRDMFLVAQIKKAIQDVESGNSLTFATGKTARRKEREAIAASKDSKLTLSKLSLVGSTAINVEDKYRHMMVPAVGRKEGSADDAWDD
ncbi:DEAD-box ATP-dependent RNA helicase 20-like [Salvia hispanica]|uniref:DEAD-box ATP-dependent RNA helicase 20-like n=1 Tax=Salvia hispanica TaxID=49212 RepID=UPI0020091254|nr:DEAD-box ATP-dependent RNA helicase 20-like [Salvia hispanica]XP_047943471.1 DEAD-box ATP-dependent RNA helicase 20-like [Salvia hispanica]